VIKKLKKKTEEDKELEIFISNLKDEENQIRKRLRSHSSSGKLTKDMENKFVKMEIKKRASEFKNIQNIESKRKSEYGEFTFSSANFEEEKTHEKEKKKSVKNLLSTMKNMVATNDMTPEEIQKKQLNDKKKELLKASSVGIVKKKLNDSSKALEIDIEELMKEENIEIKKDSETQ
jgi:alpha-L-fucosidase